MSKQKDRFEKCLEEKQMNKKHEEEPDHLLKVTARPEAWPNENLT